jgi:hypothetical protein
MRNLAAFALLLLACSKEDYKDQKTPAEAEKPEVTETKPPPPPPKKELKPEELGTCELKATGAYKAEQTTPGGRPATNVSYWLGDQERGNMGVDGFVVNCHGKDIKFSILPGGGKKDGMPFGPKKYEFKKGTGDANVMVSFTPKEPAKGGKSGAVGLTMDAPNGTVDITAFDKKHIAGTINLSGKLVPGGGAVQLTGKFDLTCPGFSKCEQ